MQEQDRCVDFTEEKCYLTMSPLKALEELKRLYTTLDGDYREHNHQEIDEIRRRYLVVQQEIEAKIKIIESELEAKIMERLREGVREVLEWLGGSIEESEYVKVLKNNLVAKEWKDWEYELGDCYVYWGAKQAILAEDYGIFWMCPDDIEPGFYD